MSTIINDLTISELKQALADQTAILVDVREADEFARGRIPGSILLPLSAFKAAALPKSVPGKQIVISCRSGQRSRIALQMAQAGGREDVTGHFPGGMLEWTGAGEPVEQD